MVILCTIDLETREVSLPAGQVIASYDHNVDVIRFQAETIPGFSLNTSSIKIAAQGPNKARHDYAVDPATVAIEEETGYITFDWPIPQGVTEMPIGTFKYGDKGQLIFAVCAEIISGSTVSKAWHSDDGIITVVAHLEPESGGGEDPEEEATNRQMIGQLRTDVTAMQAEIGGKADKIYVTPEDFGAVGDGETDDTQAIQSAINSGYPIKFENGKTYILTAITINHGTILDGNGCTIKRPNLKEDPYNYTDSQIASNIMIKFDSENTSDDVTVVKNINFDGNCWSMWTAEDGYIYESAQFIRNNSGTASHPSKLLVTDCTFKDNFSSAISGIDNSYTVISNCESTHCFKGIVTFVGRGSKLDMVNVKCFNPVYDFHTINIEINGTGSEFPSYAQSNVNLSNVYVEKLIKFGSMSGKGVLNAENLICKNMTGFTMYTGASLNIANSVFEMTNASGSYYVSIDNQNYAENLNFTNVKFVGIGEAYPKISFRNNNVVLPTGLIAFNHCTFEHMATAFEVHRANEYVNKYGVSFDGCAFKNITTAIIKGDGSGWHVNSVNFIGCVIDIDAAAYMLMFLTSYKSPTFIFESNQIVSENAGIRLYGLDSDHRLVFKGDLWDNGLAVSYFRSGTASPRVFGDRYRIVENVPTEKGFSDHDFAYVSSESNALYKYNGTTWVAV